MLKGDHYINVGGQNHLIAKTLKGMYSTPIAREELSEELSLRKDGPLPLAVVLLLFHMKQCHCMALLHILFALCNRVSENIWMLLYLQRHSFLRRQFWQPLELHTPATYPRRQSFPSLLQAAEPELFLGKSWTSAVSVVLARCNFWLNLPSIRGSHWQY